MLYSTRLDKSYTYNHYLFCTVKWSRYSFKCFISNHLFSIPLQKQVSSTMIVFHLLWYLLFHWLIILTVLYVDSYTSLPLQECRLGIHLKHCGGLFLCIIIFMKAIYQYMYFITIILRNCNWKEILLFWICFIDDNQKNQKKVLTT